MGGRPVGDDGGSWLVIGYGSDLRGDDAVGRRVAERVADWGRPGVQALSVHQLAPELAEPMSTAGQVIFVDACADGPEVCLRPLQPGTLGAEPSHTSDPHWLLALTRLLYMRQPEAWLLTVPASDLGLGEGLSAAAAEGMAVALRQLDHLVRASNREMGGRP